jgi:hypothetical protein
MTPIPTHLASFPWYAPHLAWLRSIGYATLHDPGDAAAKRAYLTRANLTDANLTGAYLTRANLTDANLTRADLTYANLTDANLTGADLTYADLTGAYRPDCPCGSCPPATIPAGWTRDASNRLQRAAEAPPVAPAEAPTDRTIEFSTPRAESVDSTTEVDYASPTPQHVYVTVRALKGRTFEPVEADCDGIAVRRDGVKEVAHVARWGAVMIALRWALERSPKMREDVRKMLDEVVND